MFPDWGARRDRGGMLGLFDPSNLEVYLDANLGADEERALLRDCKFDEAAEIVRKNARSMSDAERLDYAMRVTTEVHELRHVHDYFGTTWGHERFIRTVRDVAQFHMMWTALGDMQEIRVPLQTWGTQKDVPAVVLKYRNERNDFIAWARSQQGDIISDTAPKDGTVPSFEMTFHIPRTRKVIRKIPLGSDALMEGNALVIQKLALNHLFGDDSASRLSENLAGGLAGDDRWTAYIAVDRYLSKKLVRFWDRYQTALSDLALMPDYDDPPERRHPGLRLTLAAAAAARLGPTAHQDSDRDLDEYQEAIAVMCGWPKPRAVVEKQIAVLRTQLAALAAKEARAETAVGVWDRLLRAAVQAHLISLEHRSHAPDLFANPSTYLQSADILPPPPIMVEQHHAVFRGIGPAETGTENAAVFRQWYLLEYIVNRLLFTSTLPCPIARERDHVCNGDALSPAWKPTDACVFSRMVMELGIPNKRFLMLN